MEKCWVSHRNQT